MPCHRIKFLLLNFPFLLLKATTTFSPAIALSVLLLNPIEFATHNFRHATCGWVYRLRKWRTRTIFISSTVMRLITAVIQFTSHFIEACCRKLLTVSDFNSLFLNQFEFATLLEAATTLSMVCLYQLCKWRTQTFFLLSTVMTLIIKLTSYFSEADAENCSLWAIATPSC